MLALMTPCQYLPVKTDTKLNPESTSDVTHVTKLIFFPDFKHNLYDNLIYLSTVLTYQGEVLKLTKISRSEMGTYLCIAGNGVPPTVSKRIHISVHCKLIFVIFRIPPL